MHKYSLLIIALSAASISAQTQRATLTGRGAADRGACTIEVVVDGAAEIDIRGDTATLRNLSGQPPQWRRFECTAPLPANPVDFRFHGIDGRGRQELIRDPRNGGVAVVRISDPSGGAEGYTFEVTWGGGGYEFRRGDNRSDYGDRAPYARLPAGDTVRVCEEAVRQEAMQRFHTPNISFRRSGVNDSAGPQDWVAGIIDVRRGGFDEAYRFSCAVNFDSGRVRSMRIEPIGPPADRGSNPAATARATEGCERAVEERLHRDGYDYVDFGSLRVDDRPGRGGWIVGNVTANRWRRPESFNFSCSVNLENGNVRSVDVTHR